MKTLRWLWEMIAHQGTYKMVALFITLSLWVFIFERQEVVGNRSLNLDFVLPPQHQIVNEFAHKVQFRVKGPRMALKKFSEGTDSIKVDLSNAQEGKTIVRIYEDILPMPHGLEVISISPSSVVVELKKASKGSEPTGGQDGR